MNLKLIQLHYKHAATTGTWKPFSVCLRAEESQESWCRGVRSQDVPDSNPPGIPGKQMMVIPQRFLYIMGGVCPHYLTNLPS
jgi:hypothetical protein